MSEPQGLGRATVVGAGSMVGSSDLPVGSRLVTRRVASHRNDDCNRNDKHGPQDKFWFENLLKPPLILTLVQKHSQ